MQRRHRNRNGVCKGVGAIVVGGLMALGILIATSQAQAQFKVVKPIVHEGEFEVEETGAVLWGYDDPDPGDDEEQQRQGHELAIGYGVTDFWKPEVALELEQARGESLDATAIALENTFQLLPEDAAPVNLGFFAAYAGPIDSEAAHAIEFGPIVQLPLGPVVTTVNPFFEKTFGENREEGFAFEYAWQTALALNDNLGLGFEAFGAVENFTGDAPPLSEQEHRIGPVALLGIELAEGVHLGFDTGVLFGLTDATSDYAYKFNIALEIELGGGHEGHSHD